MLEHRQSMRSALGDKAMQLELDRLDKRPSEPQLVQLLAKGVADPAFVSLTRIKVRLPIFPRIHPLPLGNMVGGPHC